MGEPLVIISKDRDPFSVQEVNPQILCRARSSVSLVEVPKPLAVGLENVPRIVYRTVIDNNDFIVFMGPRKNTLDGFDDKRGTIEGRDHHRDQRSQTGIQALFHTVVQ